MRVVILSGSPRDSGWVDQIAGVLDRLDVPVVRRVGSAHRVPEHVLGLLRQYDAEAEPTVFITVAGMSDALSGLSDANVVSPVIACPPRSDAFAGLEFRSLGPAVTAGRISDLAVSPRPGTYFVAVASGGVWRTTNAGITWTPVFQN